MAKFKVRENFWLHGVDRAPIGPGSIVELSAEQAAQHMHKLEPVEEKDEPKRAPSKGSKSGAK